MFFIGSVFIIFGPSYVRLLVNIVMSKLWRTQEMVSTLKWYCIYLATMGLNGICESFVHSVASKNSFNQINFGYILSSMAFCASIFTLNQSQNTSIVVIANSFAMIVRIISSLIFIQSYFRGKFIIISLPSVNILIVTIITILCAIVVQFSSIYYENTLMSLKYSIQHLIIGMVCFSIYCGSIIVFLFSKHQFDLLLSILRLSKTKSE